MLNFRLQGASLTTTPLYGSVCSVHCSTSPLRGLRQKQVECHETDLPDVLELFHFHDYCTRNKNPPGAPSIATRSKDATNGAPGLATRNKRMLRINDPTVSVNLFPFWKCLDVGLPRPVATQSTHSICSLPHGSQPCASDKRYEA